MRAVDRGESPTPPPPDDHVALLLGRWQQHAPARLRLGRVAQARDHAKRVVRQVPDPRGAPDGGGPVAGVAARVEQVRRPASGTAPGTSGKVRCSCGAACQVRVRGSKISLSPWIIRPNWSRPETASTRPSLRPTSVGYQRARVRLPTLSYRSVAGSKRYDLLLAPEVLLAQRQRVGEPVDVAAPGGGEPSIGILGRGVDHRRAALRRPLDPDSAELAVTSTCPSASSTFVGRLQRPGRWSSGTARRRRRTRCSWAEWTPSLGDSLRIVITPAACVTASPAPRSRLVPPAISSLPSGRKAWPAQNMSLGRVDQLERVGGRDPRAAT